MNKRKTKLTFSKKKNWIGSGAFHISETFGSGSFRAFDYLESCVQRAGKRLNQATIELAPDWLEASFL